MPNPDHEVEHTPILFKFNCGWDPTKTITGTHPIPSSLLTSDTAQILENDLRFKHPLNIIINEIIDLYDNPGTLLQSSHQHCSICGKPSILTDISQRYPNLHDVLEPRIDFGVVGFCGDVGCMIEIKRQIHEEELREERQAAHRQREDRKAGKCQICERVEGTKSCNRCKVTTYCGKQHQKEDWKVFLRLELIVRSCSTT